MCISCILRAKRTLSLQSRKIVSLSASYQKAGGEWGSGWEVAIGYIGIFSQVEAKTHLRFQRIIFLLNVLKLHCFKISYNSVSLCNWAENKIFTFHSKSMATHTCHVFLLSLYVTSIYTSLSIFIPVLTFSLPVLPNQGANSSTHWKEFISHFILCDFNLQHFAHACL